MDLKKLTGTGVAIVTPFRKDGSIDFKSLEKLIEHIIKNNVDFIVALGTTGEAVTLTNDERFAVVNFIKETVDNRLPIVLGLGGNNTSKIVNDIKNTDFEGISAILSVAPYYNKPNQNGLYQHYKTIASVCPIPIILYNVPGRTSVNISAETTLKLANEFDNIIAIKEASGNLPQIMQIIKNRPKDFLVLSGDDALTLPMISLGANGVISVVANAFPKEFSSMVNFALKGDFNSAKNLHYKLIDIINALFVDGNPGGVKAALAILDITANNVRLPLSTVNRQTYSLLTKLIEEL
ncbi:MAG: 4-hydroxy-tetrahydrodipicolinate synthase [Bacteroidetes bacterium]|nr:MAG: 4-hydroxy-tetrahydrodipicolinate synthase [Bacteroidota bacterium]